MKSKRITSLIYMLCLCMSSMLATTFEYKGIKYEVVSSTDQTVTVAAGNSVSGEITIPKLVMDASTATAYRVVSISDYAFKDCTELTSVTFKAEITSIGQFAFANTGLTSIVVPEAVTEIQYGTFYNCSSLTSVTLSSATTSIAEFAFDHSGLTNITIPEGVTVIAKAVFQCCSSLTSIILPTATTFIDEYAFAHSGLTSIAIPEGVTSINKSTFACTPLTTITLPSHLSSIDETAFYCTGLISLDLGSSLETIGKSAFEGCSDLKIVNCTYRNLTIDENAFKDCAALENLNLEYDDKSGTIGGHAYVDLWLPSGTLWATCNVGADSPEDYGDYFAWGETTPQSSNEYSWSSYKWCNGSEENITKYSTSASYWDSSLGTSPDQKTELDVEDDAAYVNWGNDWRMPTEDQLEELHLYTTTKWTTENGVYGRKITSKTNGNSIFLPAAGIFYISKLRHAGEEGYYWSRSIGDNNFSSYAAGLNFSNSTIKWSGSQYCYGQSVRPVRASE